MSSKAVDIEKLLQEAKLKNDMLIECLFKLYFKSLYFRARGLIRESQQAKDFVQESFITLSKQGFSSFTNCKEIETFLIDQVQKSCAIYIKQKRNRPLTDDPEVYNLIEENNYEDEIINAEAIQAVKEEYNKLPPEQKELLKQQLIEGATAEEVAANMNTNRDSINKRMHLALLRLRQALDKRI